MIIMLIFILLLTACTNMLIPDIQNFRSVHLNGNGWIQIPNQNYNCANDLRVFDDNFTFEIYFSGGIKNTNSAGTIFSLTGKQTENFKDTNCNGELDEDEIDSDGNGTLDIEINDEFVVLAKYTKQGTDGWLENPDEDRRAMISGLSEKIGGKLLDLSYTRGIYDVAAVVEAPNADIMTSLKFCLLYTSPSPRDRQKSRMPSSA